MKLITRANAYAMSEHSSEPGYKTMSVMGMSVMGMLRMGLFPFSEARFVSGRCHNRVFTICSASTDSLYCSVHHGSRFFIGSVRGL